MPTNKEEKSERGGGGRGTGTVRIITRERTEGIKEYSGWRED